MSEFWSIVASFGLASPLYMPWVLARVGIYKRWYLAPFMPPFIWGKAIYGWPVSAVFFAPHFAALLGKTGGSGLEVANLFSLIGFVLAFIMIIRTPKWAKPMWQHYLESKYARAEIRKVFIPVWWNMDRKEWGRLLDSEEGIEELVQLARKNK